MFASDTLSRLYNEAEEDVHECDALECLATSEYSTHLSQLQTFGIKLNSHKAKQKAQTIIKPKREQSPKMIFGHHKITQNNKTTYQFTNEKTQNQMDIANVETVPEFPNRTFTKIPSKLLDSLIKQVKNYLQRQMATTVNEFIKYKYCKYITQNTNQVLLTIRTVHTT